MFFTKIAQNLGATAKTINISLTFSGHQLIAMVSPTFTEAAVKAQPALATPFLLKATAAQLDEGFAGAFDQYSSAINSVAEQASKQIEAIKAKPAASSTVKTTTNKSSGASDGELASLIASGASDSADDDDDDLDGKEGTSTAATATEPSNPIDSMFD